MCRSIKTTWKDNPKSGVRHNKAAHRQNQSSMSIMHSDRFKLKGLLCLCNACAGVASARVTHRTRVLPARLRLPDQAPEIQVLRFTNVVWLHYRALDQRGQGYRNICYKRAGDGKADQSLCCRSKVTFSVKEQRIRGTSTTQCTRPSVSRLAGGLRN